MYAGIHRMQTSSTKRMVKEHRNKSHRSRLRPGQGFRTTSDMSQVKRFFFLGPAIRELATGECFLSLMRMGTRGRGPLRLAVDGVGPLRRLVGAIWATKARPLRV